MEYLGLFGGQEARQTLAQIYASTTDESVKRAILRSYMIGGDKEHLFAAAKGEKDAALRADAIRQLGLVHAPDELRQLYQMETSTEVKKDILQAFFLSGDAKFLAEAAQQEKDPEVRRAAIRNLGLIGSEDARQALLAIYAKETDRENKEAVINALFIQGKRSWTGDDCAGRKRSGAEESGRLQARADEFERRQRLFDGDFAEVMEKATGDLGKRKQL